MALLYALYVVVFLLVLISPASSQLTSPVRPYQPLTGPLSLGQDPALLEIAARTGERISVELNSSHSIAIVQHGVNVNIDCRRWWLRRLIRFPGVDIQWTVQLHDQQGRGIMLISMLHNIIAYV